MQILVLERGKHGSLVLIADIPTLLRVNFCRIFDTEYIFPLPTILRPMKHTDRSTFFCEEADWMSDHVDLQCQDENADLL